MGPADDSFVLIAQLTDTHVVALDEDGNSPDELYVDNNARLTSAVSSLNAEVPALAVVLGTGDLTNWARPEEYANLAELLAPLTVPFLPIPGNHDDRDLMRATFPEVPWVDAAHASWVAVVGDDDRPAVPAVRVIGLDTTDPGKPGADFDATRELWLRAVLAEPHDGPTVLAMHHPPFATGVGWMDQSGFAGLERFVAVLEDRPVDRIVCGHFHRPVTSTVAGIPTQVCLSTVQHVDLDLACGAGPSLIVDPIGYQILRVDHSGIVTHTRYIDTGTERIIPGWAGEL